MPLDSGNHGARCVAADYRPTSALNFMYNKQRKLVHYCTVLLISTDNDCFILI